MADVSAKVQFDEKWYVKEQTSTLATLNESLLQPETPPTKNTSVVTTDSCCSLDHSARTNPDLPCAKKGAGRASGAME